MVNPTDKFDVLRNIVEQLKDLSAEEQQRVIRWACEELGISEQASVATVAPQATPVAVPAATAPIAGGPVDIKSFLEEKNPQTDIHFAVVVAYYYRFLAPEKKDAISSEDLQEAARLSSRARLANPGKTTNNAVSSGLLDSAGRGLYKVNTVGENLVAIVLPGDGKSSSSVVKRKNGKKTTTKKKPPTKRKK